MNLKNKSILITGITRIVRSEMNKHLVDEGSESYGLLRRRKWAEGDPL